MTPHMWRIALAGMAALVGTAATGLARQSQASENGIAVSLQSIREIREKAVVQQEDRMMFLNQDKAGLHLDFAMKVPGGERVIALEQPVVVKALDSTGLDLSVIERQFEELEYVDLENAWHDEPVGHFTFHLGVPARSAAQFSLSAEFKATVYSGIENLDVPLTKSWSVLDAAKFNGRKVEARLSAEQDGVEVRPATAADLLDDLAIVKDGQASESGGWFSDSRTITYSFNGQIDEAPTVRFLVRQGVRSLPIKVDIKNQALP